MLSTIDIIVNTVRYTTILNDRGMTYLDSIMYVKTAWDWLIDTPECRSSIDALMKHDNSDEYLAQATLSMLSTLISNDCTLDEFANHLYNCYAIINTSKHLGNYADTTPPTTLTTPPTTPPTSNENNENNENNQNNTKSQPQVIDTPPISTYIRMGDACLNYKHLGKHGYCFVRQMTQLQREQTLRDCIDDFGAEFVQEKVFWLHEYASPNNRRVFCEDYKFVTNNYNLQDYVRIPFYTFAKV